MYVIYLRKSRADLEAEYRGEGETLVRHEKILLELAKKQNLSIGKIYREIVSGETIASRPQMQLLLSEVEQGKWEGVLVVEVERLTRGSSIDQGIMAQAFTLSNTKIITPSKIYDPSNEFDNEYFEFSLFMSRREFKTIARRMKAGKVQSKKEGNYTGTYAPYGYDKVKLKGSPTLAINEAESKIVKMIFDLYDNSNKGVVAIATHLNKLNIPAKNNHWDSNTVRGILTNPVYVGKVRCGFFVQDKISKDGQIVKRRKRNNDCTLYDGKHEAIINEDQFKSIQDKIKSNYKAPSRTGEIKNPLAGLIVCANCGKTLVRNINAKRKNDRLRCSDNQCQNKSSCLYKVEEALLYALEERIKHYNIELLQNQNIDNKSILENTLINTEDELNKLYSKKNKLYELLENEIYTLDVFLERSKLLEDEIQFKNIAIDGLKKELSAPKKNIIPIVKNIIETYYKLDNAEEKNKLLKEIIEKVTYYKDDEIQLSIELLDM
jgi:DNA invertase Pin-like site-specific DNA recombinase